jgi:hypothetical protein
LAEIIEGLSHDSVNRFLLRERYSPKDLFDELKPHINLICGTLSGDDTVEGGRGSEKSNSFIDNPPAAISHPHREREIPIKSSPEDKALRNLTCLGVAQKRDDSLLFKLSNIRDCGVYPDELLFFIKGGRLLLPRGDAARTGGIIAKKVGFLRASPRWQ